jgi:DNA-binding transcriptional LysR family regulator
MLDLRRLRLLDELHARGTIADAVGSVTGRGRIATFQSGALRIAIPAIARLADDAPDLRCELVAAEPEDALPALALGDVDLVIGDEWRRARAVGLAELAAATWITGPRGLGWNEITERLCLEAGFAPSIRHRANDAVVAAALVASGSGVSLLPRLALPDDDPRIAVRRVAGARPTRAVYAVTRAVDAKRPSTRALLGAVRDAAVEARRRAPRPRIRSGLTTPTNAHR